MATQDEILNNPSSKYDMFSTMSSESNDTGVPDFIYDHPILSTIGAVGAAALAPASVPVMALSAGALAVASVFSPKIRATATATAADFASSVWNSTAGYLGADKITTEGILHNVSDDALTMYTENFDKIHTLSGIGGMFAVGGAAMKGMSLLRDGAKGANWFTTSGRGEDLLKVAEFTKNSKASTSLYNASTTALYTKSLINAGVDSIAAEAAIIGTMNAHPYMEDYIKDPGQNMALGILFGTVLGGSIGHVIDRKAVSNIKVGIELEANKVVQAAADAVPQSAVNAGKASVIQANVDNWQELLTPSADFVGPPRNLDNQTKILLKSFIDKGKADVAALGWNKDLGIPGGPILQEDIVNSVAKDGMVKRITTDPNFAPVEKASFVKVKLDDVATSPSKGVIGEELSGVSDLYKVKTPAKGPNKGIARVIDNKVIYHQELNLFMRPGDMVNFANVSDLKMSAEELLREVPSNRHVIGKIKDSVDQLTESSVAVDTEFLKTLLHADRMKLEDLAYTAVGENDLAMMQATVLRTQALEVEEFSKTGNIIPKKIKIVGSKDADSVGTRMVDSHQLHNEYIALKATEINKLFKTGYSAEEVSIRTNTPLESVRIVQDAAGNVEEIGNRLLMVPNATYNNMAEVPNYLAATRRSIELKTNLGKVGYEEAMRAAKLSANSNQITLKRIDEKVQEKFMVEGSLTSTVVKQLKTFFDDAGTKATKELLNSNLERLLVTGVGNKFLTSTDRALTQMGDVGTALTILGDSFGKHLNEAKITTLSPFASAARDLVKRPEALIEFNIFKEVNAGLSGKRFYEPETGRLYKLVKEGKTEKREYAKWDGQEFSLKTDEARKVATEANRLAGEFYGISNTHRRMTGQEELSNTGFWMPAFNHTNKFTAYVIDKNLLKTSIISGKTEEELSIKMEAYKSTQQYKQSPQNYDIITQGTERDLYNAIADRHDAAFDGIADVALQHKGGGAQATISSSAEGIHDMFASYNHYMDWGSRRLFKLHMNEVMGTLDNLHYNQLKGVEGQNLNGTTKFLNQQRDAAGIIQNTILSQRDLKHYVPWKQFQDIASVVTDKAMGTMAEILAPVLGGLTTKLGLTPSRAVSDAEWEATRIKMRDAGIPDIYGTMLETQAKDMYHSDRIIKKGELSARSIVLGNALMSTTMLRVFELGQAMVNVISLPVLTSAAITRQLDKSFMGSSVDPKAVFTVARTMMNGTRYQFSDEAQVLIQRAERDGLFKEQISEATKALGDLQSLDNDIVQKAHKLIENRLVDDFLAAPAKISENIVRRQSFATGLYMAKEAYPGLGEAGRYIFARDFMNRALGNYNAAQRPVMFQGTFGTGLGLFQTYMLTFIQNSIGQMESRSFKALANTLFVQGSLFGAQSLPGFHQVSEAIGNHFSDKNVDLETGLYRAIDDPTANMVLYGLPSSIGPGLSTRGDIAPRIPNPFKGVTETMPVLNFAKSTYDAAAGLAHAASTMDKGAGRALLEALQMQSIYRPLARASELMTGTSITQQGNIVQTADQVYTMQGVLARLLATRPIEEIKQREAMRLDNIYGAMDRDNRENLQMQLKSHMRGGTLSPEIIENLGEEYMRTGTPTGWRASVNKAIQQATQDGAKSVRGYLRPDSPYMQMIDDLDGY